MSRQVIHDANGPAIIDEEEFEEQGGTVAICQCGLSDNKPYCDGSHAETTDEEEDVLYRYEDGERHVVED
jgi:CDGSH-type Zn-finger protein